VKIAFLELISFLALFLLPIDYAAAENYALLVGISEYHVKPLSGPVNDATLMKKILIDKWSFKNENINLILNSAGTKKNILDGINALYKNSKPGDHIFIYLSGHGTSSGDSAFKLPLPTTSGAFVPIDIANAKTKSELINHLIIGRRDFKPLLKKLDDNGRNVFVAIDACYSGNTVRGLYRKRKLDTRYLEINELLPTRGLNDDSKIKSKSAAINDLAFLDTNLEYPYKNVYYLSASSEYEAAQDIKISMLDLFPTIDGKPHGAFSDSLLRVLNKTISSDNNNDNVISYSELKQAVRKFMRIRGFSHTPQSLPSVVDDIGKLANQGIFGEVIKFLTYKKSPDKKTTPKTKSNEKEPVNPTKISHINKKNPDKKTITKIFTVLKKPDDKILNVVINSNLESIRSKVQSIQGVKIVKTNGHLDIRKEGDTVLFISNAGDLILSLYKPSDDKIITKIRHQIWIKQLVNNPFKQDFNIELDMFANGRGSTVVEGDAIGVAIKSSQPAYILIVNINSHGTVNVLYPYTKSELTQLAAYQLLAFKEFSKVAPPFGREFLQVYAFKKITTDYKNLMAKRFEQNSSDARRFIRLIKNSSILKARSSLEVVTSERN
jgi:hypothetical protein